MRQALVVLPLLVATLPLAAENHGIIDLSQSPHARLHSVPVSAVTLGDGFWSARRS